MKNKAEDIIISHLEYIRKRVDDINGRVRTNEKSIARIKGIGIAVAFFATSLLGFFMKE